MANFRKYTLRTNREILGGRDAENNDLLVKSAKRNDVILHTEAPGSPFVNLGEKPTKEEIKEAAVFCAKYSQDWRDRKSDVVVNKFIRSDMKKGILMKAGTWSVKKFEKLKIKRSEILKLEEELYKNADEKRIH